MTIKLSKIKEDKKTNKIMFMIKGSNEVFANTIRRIIAEEVPTLAVEDVEIKANNTALFDEMLALRLGLTPIKTDLKSYRLPKSEDEITEKSAQCTLQLKLKSSKKGYVYAGDTESADPKCNFVQKEMPIVKLLPKQKIDVTMTAVMGQGIVHTKWAPGWAFYTNEPIIKVGNVKDVDEIIKKSTDGVLTKKGNKIEVNEEKSYSSQLLDFYNQHEGITVEYTDNIVFTLESWGQLTHKEILTKCADIITEKADELTSLI